jgi:photosystem II stability/assembly factor-like uncharacterized protein
MVLLFYGCIVSVIQYNYRTIEQYNHKTIFYQFMKSSNLIFRIIIAIVFVNFSVSAQWKKQNSNTDASFRSIHAISDKIVWASGSKGTILKTIDGGQNWQVIQIKGAESLDFRDIQAFDVNSAIAMSAGEAEKGAAKIYQTTDGGVNWQVVFETNEKGVFFDSFDFWNKNEGILVGDAIDEKPYLLKTSDGGKTWNRIAKESLPNIEIGEASFAASGTCIITKGKSAWFCTQNRVFYTNDKGKSWNVSQTNFGKGQTAGIFGLHFTNTKQGFAVGGDYKDDKKAVPNVATTNDGGKTWQMLTPTQPDGLKEASWLLPNKTLITIGTSGTGISKDLGKTWQSIDNQSFHAISCYKNTCWAIGGKGNLATWAF